MRRTLTAQDTKFPMTQKRDIFRCPQAEKMGFEPMHRLPDDRISSAARYDHFDTSPYIIHVPMRICSQEITRI